MTQVTEDSSVQTRHPVANRVDFDGHKFKGTFGWATDQVSPVFCPADDADFVRLSVHPDEAPDAGTLNPGDTILISVGGVLKKTTVTAIGGGGTWQPLDSDLTAISGLSTAAFGRSLLTQVDAAAVRALIGAPAVADLAGYQPLDSGLTAISALTTQAFGRSLLAQADAAAVRTLIGAGTSSFNGAYTSLSAIPAAIDALDNLTPAADRLPYFTNGTTAALATFSAFARTLLDDADAATARATLGAGTVSSVSMTVPTGFSVSGSPITGSGTLAVTLASQTADKVLASPSGASGVPAFIALSASHIPSLPWSKITTGLPTTLAGYGITDAQPYGADLTAIEALSTTGFLQRTGANIWTLVAAPTPAAHEASHRAGGSDQLALTTILGGRITDTPQFAGLLLTGNTLVNQDTLWAANSTDGNDQSALSFCGGGASSASRGAFVQARGNERPTSGGTLTLAAGDGIQGSVEVYTAGVLRATVTKAGVINITGALQQNGVDAITATRAAHITNLRVSDLGQSYLPRITDSLGTFGNSALSDDGTYVHASREVHADAGIESLGMRWASNAGKIGLLPSGVSPALGVFGFCLDNVGDVEIGAPNSVTIKAEGVGVASFTGGQLAVTGTASAGYLRATALSDGIVKAAGTGFLQTAAANTDYLPTENPTTTKTVTADVVKYRVESHSGNWDLDGSGHISTRFHIQTATGTLTLPTAGAQYAGKEYRITFHGRFSFTVRPYTGNMYYLTAGTSYWYSVTTQTWSVGDASGDNCSCDVWCDGVNWYIRW